MYKFSHHVSLTRLFFISPGLLRRLSLGSHRSVHCDEPMNQRADVFHVLISHLVMTFQIRAIKEKRHMSNKRMRLVYPVKPISSQKYNNILESLWVFLFCCFKKLYSPLTCFAPCYRTVLLLDSLLLYRLHIMPIIIWEVALEWVPIFIRQLDKKQIQLSILFTKILLSVAINHSYDNLITYQIELHSVMLPKLIFLLSFIPMYYYF